MKKFEELAIVLYLVPYVTAGDIPLNISGICVSLGLGKHTCVCFRGLSVWFPPVLIGIQHTYSLPTSLPLSHSPTPFPSSSLSSLPLLSPHFSSLSPLPLPSPPSPTGMWSTGCKGRMSRLCEAQPDRYHLGTRGNVRQRWLCAQEADASSLTTGSVTTLQGLELSRGGIDTVENLLRGGIDKESEIARGGIDTVENLSRGGIDIDTVEICQRGD